MSGKNSFLGPPTNDGGLTNDLSLPLKSREILYVP